MIYWMRYEMKERREDMRSENRRFMGYMRLVA